MKNVMRKLVKVTSAALSLAIIFSFFVGNDLVSRANTIVALPRISTHSGSPAYFVNSSGQAFNPAGYNYCKTLDLTLHLRGGDAPCKYMIDFCPGYYDANAISTSFQQFKYDGYTYVRILIPSYGSATDSNNNFYYGVGGPQTIGSDHVDGLYKPYMDNVVDAVTIANSIGIYVQIAFDWMPDNDYYYPGTKPSHLGNINSSFLWLTAVNKKALYVKNFIKYIKDVEPNLLSTIISVDFQNELYVTAAEAPYTLTGNVTLDSTGGTYNMSVDAERQQSADASFVEFANKCMSELHSVDPYAMGGASVFTHAAIGLLNGPNGIHGAANDPRNPARPSSLSIYSNLSYIDIHLYPNDAPYYPNAYNLDQDLNSSEYSYIDKSVKPLWMGEFGAYKAKYSTVTAAAYAMKDFKNAVKAKGFKAWGYWTWNNYDQSELWHGIEINGAVNGQLAPSVWGF